MADGTTVTTTFSTTLDTLLGNVTTVADFFINMFVSVADMLFSSPFVLYIGISVCLLVLGTAAGYLRIRRGGRRRR